MADQRSTGCFDTYKAFATEGARSVEMRVYEPKEPSSQTPTVIANGWATCTRTLDLPAQAMAERGIPVVTFNHQRVNGGDPTERKVDTLGSVVCAAAALFNSKVKIRAYSEGLVHATRFASQHPGNVVAIDAVCGYGLAPTTVDGLLRRVADELRQLHRPSVALAKAAFFGVRYATENLQLTAREAIQAGSVDVLPDLDAALRRRIPITLGFAERDHVSPARDSINTLNDHSLPVTVVRFHGGHFHFLLDRAVSATMDRAVPTLPVRRGRRIQRSSLPQAA